MGIPCGSLLLKPLHYWDQQGDIFQWKLQIMKIITEKDKSFAI